MEFERERESWNDTKHASSARLPSRSVPVILWSTRKDCDWIGGPAPHSGPLQESKWWRAVSAARTSRASRARRASADHSVGQPATPHGRCQDTHLLYCCWGVGGWAGRHCGAGLKGWRCGAAAMGGLAVPLLDSNWIGITLSPGCMGGGDGCT